MIDTDAAYVELAEAKKAVRASRRAFARSPEGAFARAMRDAMGEYHKARAAGVSRDDAVKGLEHVLREVWPNQPSKFGPACDACEDTGYVEHTCWDQHRCGRQRCARNPELQHAYVTPCHCAKGDLKRTRVRGVEDQIAAAVKTAKKRGGFSRIGA